MPRTDLRYVIHMGETNTSQKKLFDIFPVSKYPVFIERHKRDVYNTDVSFAVAHYHWMKQEWYRL